MIVDSLTHITPDGAWFDSKLDASTGALLRSMDDAGVERSVVVALAGFIPNDFVLAECRRHADRLIPGGSFDPSGSPSAPHARATFRSEFKDSGFQVLKLHPRLNQYDPLDERCLAILDELSDWESPLPVWLDSLLYTRSVQLRKPLVDTLHEIVTRFPRLTFVLLHGGGGHLLPMADAIRDCYHCWLDLSFTVCRYAGSGLDRDMQFLLRTFDRRVVIGSDFPEYGCPDTMRRMRELGQELDPEKRANVLGGNLARMLNLDQSVESP